MRQSRITARLALVKNKKRQSKVLSGWAQLAAPGRIDCDSSSGIAQSSRISKRVASNHEEGATVVLVKSGQMVRQWM